MPLGAWPAVVDDDGSTQFGTIFNAAFFAAIKASIEASIFNVAGTAPKDISDEVLAARGSKASVDARLDISINEDGTLKAISGYPLTATLQSQIGAKNIVSDSLLALWPDGDTSAPYSWTLSGTGASVARTGSGGGGYETSAPGDSTKLKFGKFAAKVTRGSADAKLTKNVIASVIFPSGWQGKKVCALMRGVTSVGNQLTITVDDGVATTTSTAHTGGGTEEAISVLHTLSNTASKLDIYVTVAGSGSAIFGNFCVARTDQTLADWFPERWGYYIVPLQQTGNATVANQINETRHVFEIPVLMFNTRLACKTAPLTTAITVRPAKGTGTYPYSTQPTIAASATSGSRRPEGTYANRCFKPGDLLTWDITTIGTGTVGAEVNVSAVFIASLAEMDILNE